MVAAGNGTLYGATPRTIFELAPPEAPGGSWTKRLLYGFSRRGGDGLLPHAGLVFGSNGALYGTTVYGGLPAKNGMGTVEGLTPPAEVGMGTVFELSPPAAPGRPWTEKVLHRFTGDGS